MKCVQKRRKKHTANTGLLARPHSIRKTRLNVFIRSGAGEEEDKAVGRGRGEGGKGGGHSFESGVATLPETDQ